MKLIKLAIIFPVLFFACTPGENYRSNPNKPSKNLQEELIVPVAKRSLEQFVYDPDFIADAFDYPVGKPDAKGYYNAQGFGKNYHLGDDWNAVTGGNSDLGDPIYSIANGYVKFAADLKGGWGNVIRILHQLPDRTQIESVYAHCHKIIVESGSWVKKGQQIGTIGNVNGLYLAHLHFEIRDDVDMDIGGGYSEDQEGYLDPTEFIKDHREIRE